MLEVTLNPKRPAGKVCPADCLCMWCKLDLVIRLVPEHVKQFAHTKPELALDEMCVLLIEEQRGPICVIESLAGLEDATELPFPLERPAGTVLYLARMVEGLFVGWVQVAPSTEA